MNDPSPRLAVRAVILQDDRLLMVNAFPGDESDLWCVPGGGVERHASLPENLAREVHEECGARIEVGAPCLVNEFHDPGTGFHQVDVFFRCRLIAPLPDAGWQDPAGIVNRRRLVHRNEMSVLRYKPSCLPQVAWGGGILYDPLERLIR